MDGCFTIVFYGICLLLLIGIISRFLAYMKGEGDTFPLVTPFLCRTVNIMALLLFCIRIWEYAMWRDGGASLTPAYSSFWTSVHAVNPAFILLLILLNNLMAYHMGHMDESRFAYTYAGMTILALYLFFRRGELVYGLALCLSLNMVWVIMFMICRRLVDRGEKQKHHLEEIISSKERELEEMEEQIRRLQRPIYEGNIYLSPAERHLLSSVRNFKTVNTKELASRMFRAESTIGNSIYNIRKKLNLTSRADLYAYVMMCIPEEKKEDRGESCGAYFT